MFITTKPKARSAVALRASLRPRNFSSSWASSLSASGSRREGYFRNSHNGARADREHNESLRWRTIFRPSSALSIENVASYNHAHQKH